MNLEEFAEITKQKLIAECVQCGKCVKSCRVMAYTEIDAPPAQIQRGILRFLKGGKLPGESAAKVGACMHCYGCLDVDCPIGTDSMTINELVTKETEERKPEPWSMDPYPVHDELARKHTSDEEYRRITAARVTPGAEALFFPGCNIYKQPDKLLNALTIMDEIGRPYSFAPGIEYCCGFSIKGTLGNMRWLQETAQRLMDFAETLEIKRLIFWCPTCMCNLKNRVALFYDPPFACITFGEYMAENLSKLRFPNAGEHTVTYHEPCKAAYMGIDTDSVRRTLEAIPGTKLREMERRGKDTMCCGCDAVSNDFETGDRITTARIAEAIDTGADTMIDVCHNCHWIFKAAMKNHLELEGRIAIENYAAYIVKAMGKGRADSLG